MAEGEWDGGVLVGRLSRGQLCSQLMANATIARDIGGAGCTWTRAKEVALRSGRWFARVVEVYARWVETSPRQPCPECMGEGVVRYADAGGECPCMTCGGEYERGRGWVEVEPGWQPRRVVLGV